jgi:hypothetical protein
MAETAAQPPPELPWKASYLRLIAFPVESQLAATQNWLQDLTKVELESSVKKKQEREDTGVVDGHALKLSIDPMRIVWIAAPVVKPDDLLETADIGLPVLGPLGQKHGWFDALMKKWLLTCPQIRRLAFAASLLVPVQTRKDGHELLNRFLPSVDLDPESSDFSYVINRRRASKSVTGLQINRLMKWACTAFKFQLQGVVGESVMDLGPKGIQKRFAAQLDLDINTVPEPTDLILPQDKLGKIWTELVGLGLEIAEQGDIR